jgi:DNA (cytosine-5)-methyltransferase 1
VSWINDLDGIGQFVVDGAAIYKKQLRVLDLFSGIGSFSLGLEHSGMKSVAFCEIEEKPTRQIKRHWPSAKLYSDVKTLTKERLDSDGVEPIDVICGGFPCQDISIAGGGAGLSGDRSGLWFEFKRIIDDVRPQYAIVENVSALLGRGLSTVLGGLAEIGYDAAWTVYDSQYFGLPQRRRRVYILAVRDGIPAGADIFNNQGRSTGQCRSEVELIDSKRQWHFEEGEGEREATTFYTRQRSDEFSCTGLSSTLAKRDYKSFTDLVVSGGNIRRVTPKERLNLQGIYNGWLDNLGLSDSDKFRLNGMSVPVVKHIGDSIYDFHNKYRV